MNSEQIPTSEILAIRKSVHVIGLENIKQECPAILVSTQTSVHGFPSRYGLTIKLRDTTNKKTIPVLDLVFDWDNIHQLDTYRSGTWVKYLHGVAETVRKDRANYHQDRFAPIDDAHLFQEVK